VTGPRIGPQPAIPGTARRLVLVLCFGLLAMVSSVGLFAWAQHDGPLRMDFFGIWSWARFAAERPPAMIYDHAEQHAFLLSLDPAFPVPMPFPYPPPYLLLIWPLGHLPYFGAHVVWSGTTLVAYLAAVCLWRPRALSLALALVAPATLVNLFYGQNGFLTAALLVGGFGMAASNPVLAGVLLGLLSYKPQFGLLVAVALIAGRSWRCALAAALTVAALVVASTLAFGIEPWMAWAQAMPEFVAIVDGQRARLLHLMPTALANALALGVGDRFAGAVQSFATVTAAACVWIAFRRGSGPLPVAALATAAMLASPYAFVYDLTLVAAAVTLFAVERRAALTAGEALILTGVLLIPVAMVLHIAPPLAAAANAVVLAMILARFRIGPARQCWMPPRPADARRTDALPRK